jgi:Sec-independent protein translocase protein TatA
MFDISYSPWLILAIVGLIFFRPDDWQELAFHVGKKIRYLRAYAAEWQEFMSFDSVDTEEKNISQKNASKSGQQHVHMCWPTQMTSKRSISVQPL